MNLKFFISTGSFIFCFLILSVKSDESEEKNVDIISLKPEHVDQNWKTFKAKHNRRYKNKTHESTKRAVFEKNLKIINDLNTQYKNGKISYKAGINRFSDMTKEEFRAFVNKGTNRPNTKYSNSINYTTIDIGQLKSLPASIDWRKNGAVSPVKNQGNCGSCWAFSAVCALEGQYFKVNKKLVQLSEQNLVDCTYDSSRDGCQGGWPTEAFDYVKTNNGIDINSQYPYVSGFNAISGSCKYESGAKSGAKVTGFKVVTDGKRNINAVKNALATIGPVSAALLVTDNFMHYKGGIFSDSTCTGSDTPNHAIALVGYGTDSKRRDYFILRNSWSENWGEKGYMRISQNNNMCSISSYVSYPILSKSQISTTPATSTTSRNNQVYNQIPSSDTGGQNDFNFSISNDQSYDLKLFWIDWNHSFILYSVIPSGGQYRQLSFSNHAWVLANNENKKCLVFKLGQTNLFTVSDQTIKVSDMTGDECNPNDVQY